MAELSKSYERITTEDLRALLEISLAEREAFFDRRPKYRKHYYDSLLCIALCQGAALHYVDAKNGVKDFDVYWFYRQPRSGKIYYPYRAMASRDSRLTKFGRDPQHKSFSGRKVDLMGREIDFDIVERNRGDPVKCVVDYLQGARTKTARELARKAVVSLYPESVFGKVIWSLG